MIDRDRIERRLLKVLCVVGAITIAWAVWWDHVHHVCL